jgi:hypothetical protein
VTEVMLERLDSVGRFAKIRKAQQSLIKITRRERMSELDEVAMMNKIPNNTVGSGTGVGLKNNNISSNNNSE